jgi:hypothetical protein
VLVSHLEKRGSWAARVISKKRNLVLQAVQQCHAVSPQWVCSARVSPRLGQARTLRARYLLRLSRRYLPER